MGLITTSAGRGRHCVECVAATTGAGLVVTITGGERPHVGAVGLGLPRPSLSDPQRLSATSSVLTVVGHRDDELAKPLAAQLAAGLNQVAVVVVGVHVANATAEDIELLSANVRLAAAALLERLQAGGHGAQDKRRQR